MDLLEIYQNVLALIEPGPCEFKHKFLDRTIAVRLTIKEVVLSVNGSTIERTDTVLRPRADVPLLTGSIKDNDTDHILEVFGKSGLFRGKIKLCIDGVKVAGDDF